VKVLLSIGDWLRINGEGIYNTRPWEVAEEGPTVAAEGSFSDQKPVTYTSRDIRFTSKDNEIYVFLLEVPTEEKIPIRSLGLKANKDLKIVDIELLGSSEEIKWTERIFRDRPA
jgi:alpha-L-fucosidase